MRLLLAKKDAVCSAVQCWLAKGASMASAALDGWIWATVTSLFEGVCEVVRRLFESVWFCGSYEKDTFWRETTAEGRDEVWNGSISMLYHGIRIMSGILVILHNHQHSSVFNFKWAHAWKRAKRLSTTRMTNCTCTTLSRTLKKTLELTSEAILSKPKKIWMLCLISVLHFPQSMFNLSLMK